MKLLQADCLELIECGEALEGRLVVVKQQLEGTWRWGAEHLCIFRDRHFDTTWAFCYRVAVEHGIADMATLTPCYPAVEVQEPRWKIDQ